MNESLNNGSQMICTKRNYDDVRKDEKRKRSFSGPPLDNLVDILEECKLSASDHQTNAIQSNLHSPNNSTDSTLLDQSINSNVSSQLNNSINSNQLNLSTRSNTSNDSTRSNESSDYSNPNHSDRKSNQVINYLLNQAKNSDQRIASSKLSPDDFTTPDKRNSQQRDYRTNSIDNRVRYMSGDTSQSANVYR